MGKLRDWINRDDGRYFQAGNENLNWLEVVGILLSVAAFFSWHLNTKNLLDISPMLTGAAFGVAFILVWIGQTKKKDT